MTKRYLISVEPIEPSGVVLTIAELPGLVIFGQTAEDALGWAREAIKVEGRGTACFSWQRNARDSEAVGTSRNRTSSAVNDNRCTVFV
jgi:hypothetical protein